MIVLATASVLVGACGHEFEPPDRSERIREQEARYSTALFDSVGWVSDELRREEGNLVYVEDCRRCHGPLGLGETDYAAERGLDVPSLVEPEWRLAQIDSLRRSIFVGHEDAMPIYGDGDLTPRQIDGVSAYLLEILRPEVEQGR